jgi:hypothetical protein
LFWFSAPLVVASKPHFRNAFGFALFWILQHNLSDPSFVLVLRSISGGFEAPFSHCEDLYELLRCLAEFSAFPVHLSTRVVMFFQISFLRPPVSERGSLEIFMEIKNEKPFLCLGKPWKFQHYETLFTSKDDLEVRSRLNQWYSCCEAFVQDVGNLGSGFVCWLWWRKQGQLIPKHPVQSLGAARTRSH